MDRTLLRAGALSCALLASTALTGPAMAQTMPPAYRSVDANGVDAVQGDFVFNFEEGAIGSGRARLPLTRQRFGSTASQYDGTRLRRTRSGNVFTFDIGLPGGTSNRFTGGVVGSVPMNSAQGNGATLVKDGWTYVYRAVDGTTITFIDPTGAAEAGLPATAFCAYNTQSSCDMLADNMMAPDGSSVTFRWNAPNGAEARLEGVANSFSYSIAFDYESDVPGTAAFMKRVGARFLNDAAGTTSQASVSYAYPSSTAIDVTNTAGDTWRFSAASASDTRIAGIRRPGATSDTTTVAYSGGMVSAVVREGVSTSYAFSVSGLVRTATITDALSHTTTVTSSIPLGRPNTVTDPLGRTTSYFYDSYGRLTEVAAPEGNHIDQTYDARGNVTQTSVVAKSGSGLATISSSATYPSRCTNPVTCNLPTSTTDARGKVTDYTYDGATGNVLTVTGPAPTAGADRPQVRYAYTTVSGMSLPTEVSSCASGTAPACVGTAAERRQVTAYDAQGNVTSVTQRDGTGALSAISAMTYDTRGNVVSVDGPLAGTADTTHMRYDAGSRLTGLVSPDPDGAGSLPHRAVRMTYAAGLPVKQEAGTVASPSDSDWSAMNVAQETQVTYDVNARPTVQKLVSGSTVYSLTQTGYDALGRPDCTAQRMNPAAFASLPTDACTLGTEGAFGPDRIARTSYDAAGQVTRVQSGYGTGVQADEATVTYTDNGRTETLTDGEGNKTTYVYDGHDRVSRMRYPDLARGAGTSSTTDYEELTYDAAGNVTSQRLRNGNSIGYTYDALNRVTAKDLPGSEPDVSYAYDLLGQMVSAGTPAESIAFTYDALGRSLSQADSLYGTTSQTYDLAGRRSSLTYPVLGFTVGYNHLVTGELSQVLAGTTPVVTFGYDSLGRRSSITRANTVVTSYGYDAAGRLSSLAHDLPGGSANDVTFGFTYNPAGQIAGRTVSNDAYSFTGVANRSDADTHNGLNQVTQTGTTSVTHDGRGNTNAIGSSSYSYTAENHLASGGGGVFTHDPLGRMASSSASTTDFARGMDDQLLVERTTGGTAKAYYVPGEGPNEPLYSYDSAGESYLLSDERGSIIASTDASGNLKAINRYDDYGQPQGGSVTGRFGYTGQAWLPELGMYDYHARVYNPKLGRFMEADPIGYSSGLNSYIYAGEDPINFVDSNGLSPKASCPPGTQSDGFGGCMFPSGGLVVTGPGSSGSFPGLRTYFGGGGGGAGGGGDAAPSCRLLSREGNTITITASVDFRNGNYNPVGYQTTELGGQVDQGFIDQIISAMNGSDFSGWNRQIGPYNVQTRFSYVPTGGNYHVIVGDFPVIAPALVEQVGSVNMHVRMTPYLFLFDAKIIHHELGHSFGNGDYPNSSDEQLMRFIASGRSLPRHIERYLTLCGLNG